MSSACSFVADVRRRGQNRRKKHTHEDMNFLDSHHYLVVVLRRTLHFGFSEEDYEDIRQHPLSGRPRLT
jgi:hypothetical protein